MTSPVPAAPVTPVAPVTPAGPVTPITAVGLDRIVAAHGPARKQLRRGTHRITDPADTLRRVRPHFERTGITRVADITGLDTIGIPVVMVIRPNSRGLSTSQGKGLTLDAAKASGVMEALELWHGEHLHLPVQRASADEMRARVPLVPLDRLPRGTGGEVDPGLQVLWVVGTDLVSGGPLALPEEVVGVDRTVPRFPRLEGIPATSNGLASGNHPLEAIAHGLFEVVERDATTLFTFADEATQAARRIDLDTVADPDCRALLDRCHAAGVTVLAWDVTSDIGLPVVDCALFDTVVDPWRPLPVGRGQGAHPSRVVAFVRAVTEAAQDRLTVIAGGRDDVGYDSYDVPTERLRREWAATLAEESAPVAFTDLPDRAHETCEADIRWVLDRLVAVGLDQVAAVDLSQPDIGVCVWRVVVPGLEYTSGDLAHYRPGTRVQDALAAASRVATSPGPGVGKDL